ncbi:site-specific integrase [Variovorax sp. J22R115]|uniref:tyrosine-type recombinase/integrase n=1 Tax=Variovorax sp. J22R115 TaxID=3053509 RepID=UPI002575D802|nr:site-specific integrase [Variovorax sp. J22R115]MDM0049297.1 integrase arm-type DNA-binding domain-containing protein [Variovorax sp. J22R115]
MPKIARELSALEVSRLTAPGLVAVGVVPGLQLQITPSGARSWVLRVKVGSKRRDMGLGSYPGTTLAQAREKARHARKEIEQGVDPILRRERAQSALRAEQASEKTFTWCAQQYIDAHGDTWRNPKHRTQWTNTLATYAYPLIGSMLVRDVSQSHILQILGAIWKTKNETASRLRGRLEVVLDWAKTQHYRDGENPARWKGHLDKLLPAPGKVQRVQHHPAVPIDDAATFFAELRQREGIAARALEFVALTAARSGEVRGATWDELDLDAAIWIIPGARMKAEREHRVPLSKAVLALLKALPRIVQPEEPERSEKVADLVFSAPRGGSLSDMALTQVMRRMGQQAVPHGLRSTFRDWCGERTNFPRDLAEQALAHSLADKTEAAYRRGDALEKRRVMMETWAKFLTTPRPTSAAVTPIRKRANALA